MSLAGDLEFFVFLTFNHNSFKIQSLCQSSFSLGCICASSCKFLNLEVWSQISNVHFQFDLIYLQNSAINKHKELRPTIGYSLIFDDDYYI
ncbi:hypothetical protein BpHYR1_034685 [Brachionus plicatilis]|uniref:Uncharacterized protein n=1 Tax=Brachionus plicatilis TaxID=10195 RepID=A0A3M7SHD5_BRAPC|nr:hypothetical protein BpHYR1_034685 [Brachionus plicatilis]